MALTPGTRFGPYEIQSPLGVGGMGEVYRAHDPQLNRDVAIKVLSQLVSSEPDSLRRFEREARAAAALNHPNILAVYQMGTYEGAPYLVSELLEGQTLQESLRIGPLPLHKAIDYGVQIANALSAAHEKGIVHRDLKPGNLFCTKDGRSPVCSLLIRNDRDRLMSTSIMARNFSLKKHLDPRERLERAIRFANQIVVEIDRLCRSDLRCALSILPVENSFKSRQKK